MPLLLGFNEHAQHHGFDRGPLAPCNETVSGTRFDANLIVMWNQTIAIELGSGVALENTVFTLRGGVVFLPRLVRAFHLDVSSHYVVSVARDFTQMGGQAAIGPAWVMAGQRFELSPRVVGGYVGRIGDDEIEMGSIVDQQKPHPHRGWFLGVEFGVRGRLSPGR